MTKKKSLQKLTVSKAKVNKVMALKKITPEDLAELNKAEIKHLFEHLNNQFNDLEGVERDKLYRKIELVVKPETKNQLWEYNHIQVTWALSTMIQDYGRLPSTKEIANKTGLSRQTVHKHLKEYKEHPLYSEQIEQFKFLSSKVLARVFQFAVNGDVAAARLYFKVIGLTGESSISNSTLINNQNNYIQINGITLTQETLKDLNPDQLKSIESIIKEVVK